MISRNDSPVVAQSTTSTFQGGLDAEKSSASAAVIDKIKGSSLITARSKSEYFLAVHVAREPKAHTHCHAGSPK
jgi:hypothetical protein